MDTGIKRKEHDAEAIITAAICYHEVFKKTVLKSIPDPRITKTQMDVMVILYEDGPLKMSDISARLSVTREQVTRAVKSLKEMELVETERVEEDGRSMTSSLTAAGQSFIVKQRKNNLLHIGEYLAQLPEEDQAALVACSRQAAEVFKRNGAFPVR